LRYTGYLGIGARLNGDHVDNGLENLAPANGANAIVSAAFAIDLDIPLGDPSLVTAFGLLAPQMIKAGFDPPQAQTLFSMAFGPVMTTTTGMQQLGGYAFARKNTAGQLVREFAFRGNSISVVVHDYTRWTLIWPEVEALFALCSPMIVGSGKAIKSIALQYIDKFTWRQPDSQFPTKAVLRTGSPQILPAALELDSPWHNQFGCQRALPSDSWASNRIENVNMSLAPEGGFNALTIFTIYRYFARNPGKESPDFVTAVAPALFNQAHDDNKRLLREILSDSVCEMIKLNN
jgi:uncharacterized protein (TIGR04255 family)